MKVCPQDPTHRVLSELLDDIIVIIVMTNHISDKPRDWTANKDTGLASPPGRSVSSH